MSKKVETDKNDNLSTINQHLLSLFCYLTCAAQFIHLIIFLQFQFIIYNRIEFKYTLFSTLTDVDAIDQSKKPLLTNEWFCSVNLAKQINVVILFLIILRISVGIFYVICQLLT